MNSAAFLIKTVLNAAVQRAVIGSLIGGGVGTTAELIRPTRVSDKDAPDKKSFNYNTPAWTAANGAMLGVNAPVFKDMYQSAKKGFRDW